MQELISEEIDQYEPDSAGPSTTFPFGRNGPTGRSYPSHDSDRSSTHPPGHFLFSPLQHFDDLMSQMLGQFRWQEGPARDGEIFSKIPERAPARGNIDVKEV